MERQRQRVIPGIETWRSTIALSVVVAVVLLVFWSLRDGFSGGAVVGAAVIGIALCAVLAALRRSRSV